MMTTGRTAEGMAAIMPPGEKMSREVNRGCAPTSKGVMKRSFAFLLMALPAWASWAELPLDEACRESDLVVVATLEDLKPFTRGEGRDEVGGVDARIRVREVLYGKGEESLPFSWENPTVIACPRVEHGEHVGKERIWLLQGDGKGPWRADHPDRALPPERLEEVRELLRKRIEPDLRRLRECEEVDLPFFDKERDPGPEDLALGRLRAAGKAALPAARELLGSKNPAARAWGLRLAQGLADAGLRRDLEMLLNDRTPLRKVCCVRAEETTLGAEAKRILDKLRPSDGAGAPPPSAPGP